jgi:hypothetical protein
MAPSLFRSALLTPSSPPPSPSYVAPPPPRSSFSGYSFFGEPGLNNLGLQATEEINALYNGRAIAEIVSATPSSHITEELVEQVQTAAAADSVFFVRFLLVGVSFLLAL